MENIINLCLTNKCDLYAKNNDNQTCLDLAIIQNNLNFIKCLLAKNYKLGMHELHIACKYN